MASRDTNMRQRPKASDGNPHHLDLAQIIARMDHTTLVVALIAANPDLDDILPDDPKLKEDMADIRAKIAERRLRLDQHPGEINRIVENNVHIHLWDQHTSERLKALGASVAALFKTAMEKLVEAKVQFIDNDTRETMTPKEALDGFKESFRGMAEFIKGDIPVGKIAMMLVGSLPPKEEDKEAVIRVASGAVGDILDAKLNPVAQPSTSLGDDLFDDDALYEDDVETKPKFVAQASASSSNDPFDDDALYGEEDLEGADQAVTQYVIRSSTPVSPHYVTDKPGETSYNRADAAKFSKREADQLAEDLSSYAATKGYGYRYQTEEADIKPIHQISSSYRLSS